MLWTPKGALRCPDAQSLLDQVLRFIFELLVLEEIQTARIIRDIMLPLGQDVPDYLSGGIGRDRE